MARVQGHRTRTETDEEREYDPATETDPLVRRYVTLPPPFAGKNDPIIIGRSGAPYSVWGIYLNYLINHRDAVRALEGYGDDLTPEHLRAAERFAELYPDLIMPYIEPHLGEQYGRRARSRA
jgi:hypothetical protein